MGAEGESELCLWSEAWRAKDESILVQQHSPIVVGVQIERFQIGEVNDQPVLGGGEEETGLRDRAGLARGERQRVHGSIRRYSDLIILTEVNTCCQTLRLTESLVLQWHSAYGEFSACLRGQDVCGCSVCGKRLPVRQDLRSRAWFTTGHETTVSPSDPVATSLVPDEPLPPSTAAASPRCPFRGLA